MAKNKVRKKKKSGAQKSKADFHSKVNRVIRDLWVKKTSMTPKDTLFVDRPLSKQSRSMRDLLGLKMLDRRYYENGRYGLTRSISSYHLEESIASEALKISANTLQPWPFVVIALQTDGKDFWYDTLIHVTSKDYVSATREYSMLIYDTENKLIKNINEKYLIGVGTFIFNDRSIDFDAMTDQLVLELENDGCFDREKSLAGILSRIKANDPELYPSALEEASVENLGRIIKFYYKRQN